MISFVLSWSEINEFVDIFSKIIVPVTLVYSSDKIMRWQWFAYFMANTIHSWSF